MMKRKKTEIDHGGPKHNYNPELSSDALRLVFEFANLNSFVFWPNAAEAGVLAQARCAFACSCVNLAWREAAMGLPTRVCGQPPHTFGDDPFGVTHRAAFAVLTKTRAIETLDLYTLGNHAKAPPACGRTRIELEPLLALPRLKTLRISASALAHSGNSLAALAVLIAARAVTKCAFRLKTGDPKPKALVVSPAHKAQPLDKLAEAVLTTPASLQKLSVRYEQRPGTVEEYNRSLVIQRREHAPSEQLRMLVSTALKHHKQHDHPDAPRPLVRLDSELTLLTLYSHTFAQVAAKEVHAVDAQLALTFEHRLSETELRRFQRLSPSLASCVAAVRWADDEARSGKLVELLPALRCAGPLKLTPRCALRELSCFNRLVELLLTGEPSPEDVPSACHCADLRYTLDFSRGPRHLNKPPQQQRLFDFSHHMLLRHLSLSGYGALWVVRRLPPRAKSIALESVHLRPDAYLSLASPELDMLRLQSCAPLEVLAAPSGRRRMWRPESVLADCFSLPEWLSRTGVKHCFITDCDFMNWSLGASLNDLCHALRYSRVQRLRLSAFLARGTFASQADSQAANSETTPRPRDAVLNLLDANLRPHATAAAHDQLRVLFDHNSSVFFDLYYRSGHFCERPELSNSGLPS